MSKLTNRFDADEAIVSAVANDSYDSGDSDISITGLARSPQQRILQKRHADKIVEDVSDRLPSLRGQIAHSIVERSALHNEWSEKRISIDVLGWKISGKPDKLEAVVLSGGILIDHKFPTLSSFLFGFQRDKGLKPEHIAQGNCYRYLLAENGVKVDKIIFKSTLLEWSRRHARTKKDYPDRPFYNFEIPLWSMDETKAYIYERVRLHQEAEKLTDDKLPDCLDTERWQQNGVWKVYGTNKNKSLKNFEGEGAEQQAIFYGKEKNAEVKYKPGEAVKCLDYCVSKPYCHQLRRETPEGIDMSMHSGGY